jgi:hypothetical protein
MKIGTVILVMVILIMLFGGLISEYVHQGEALHESRDENQSLYSVIQDLKTSLENAYAQIDQLAEDKNTLKQENEILQGALRDSYTIINQLDTRAKTLEQKNLHLQQLVEEGNLTETDAPPLVNLPTQIMIVVVFLAGGIGSRIFIKNNAPNTQGAGSNDTTFILVTKDEAKAIASRRRDKKEF